MLVVKAQRIKKLKKLN